VQFKLPLILTIFFLPLIQNTCFAEESLLHEILEASDQRNSAAPVFERVLAGNNQKEQRQALLALGRIGDKSSTLKISPFLYSKQPDIRTMAAFALGINKDIEAHKLLSQILKTEKHPVVISQLLISIGNLGHPEGSIASILPFLSHQDDQVVAAACDGLTLAWTFHRSEVSIPNSTQVTKLLKLTNKNQQLAEHCLFTLSRLRQDSALFNQEQLKKVALNLTTDGGKILAIRIMGAMQNPDFKSYFINLSTEKNPARIRAEAAASIAGLGYQKDTLAALKKLAQDHNTLVQVNLIANLPLDDQPLVEIVEQALQDKSYWVRRSAMLALFGVKHQQLQSKFLSLLKADDFRSQQLALEKDFKSIHRKGPSQFNL